MPKILLRPDQEIDADSDKIWAAFHRNQQINPANEFLLPSSSPKSNALLKKKRGGDFSVLPNYIMLKTKVKVKEKVVLE